MRRAVRLDSDLTRRCVCKTSETAAPHGAKQRYAGSQPTLSIKQICYFFGDPDCLTVSGVPVRVARLV